MPKKSSLPVKKAVAPKQDARKYRNFPKHAIESTLGIPRRRAIPMRLAARFRHRFSIPRGLAETNLTKTARYAGEYRHPLHHMAPGRSAGSHDRLELGISIRQNQGSRVWVNRGERGIRSFRECVECASC